MSLRIAEIEPNTTVTSFFALASMREGRTRSGGTFLTLGLQDRTGTTSAKIWSPATVWRPDIAVPSVVRVTARTELYRDELQFQIDHIEPYTPTHAEYEALMPCSLWEPALLVRELRLHIELAVRAPVLRHLLLAVLDHPEVRERLPVSPAAAGNHHAYRAGLVEHTLSMMRLASLIGQHYAQYYPGVIEPDLLVAGVLLHDLGKVWELEGDLVTTYSTPGNLVGHIPMGAAFIERVAREQGGIPVELVWELQHLILSHHGQYEYGSPKLPATIEAQILHFIDTMDARTNTFVGELGQEGWSFTNRLPGKVILNPAALRRTWTEPLAGPPGVRGPGTPWGEAPASVSATNQPTATAVAPTPSAALNSAPAIIAAPAPVAAPEPAPAIVTAPTPMAAPNPAPAIATTPLPEQAAALPSGEVESVEVSPISRPLTLSLFDGLS